MKWELNNNSWDAGKVVVTTSTEYDFGSLQLATNGKIYMAKYFNNNPISSSEYVAVIDKPEDKVDNRFITNAINLEAGSSFKGLPNFIQSYFRNRIITQNQCVSESLDFTLDAYANIESVLWEFGDGTTSTDKDTNHKFSNPGKYIVKATMTLNNQPVEVFKEVIVYPLPELKGGQTLLQCDTDNDGVATFNLYNIEEKMVNPANIEYEFSFYTSIDDAQNNINKIQIPELYNNQSNPQEIFVEIISPEGCKTLSSFFLETTYTSLDGIETMVTCEISDDIYDNNEGIFNLRSKEDQIRNQFNIPATSNILFYSSFQDAETKTNNLSAYYTSTSTTIWVRIDDRDFGCFGIEPIELIVNSTVEMLVEDSYTICDSNLQSTIILDGGKSNSTWEWKDENGIILSTNPEFALNKPGKYMFSTSKTENDIVCQATKTFIVNETSAPLFQKVKGEDYQIFVAISGESDYEYSLDNMNFSGNGLNHTFYSVSAGVYTVYVRDKNNCEPTISTKVSLIGFPKYFTPNGDGYNDIWQVEGLTADLYSYADIIIFDRYGKYLYKMDLAKNQQGWDGTFNGALLTPTDYWFKARLIDNENNIFEKIGHFSLKQ
jgi:gliding motility-associated-like protein